MTVSFNLRFHIANPNQVPLPVASALVATTLFPAATSQKLGAVCVTLCADGTSCNGTPPPGRVRGFVARRPLAVRLRRQVAAAAADRERHRPRQRPASPIYPAADRRLQSGGHHGPLFLRARAASARPSRSRVAIRRRAEGRAGPVVRDSLSAGRHGLVPRRIDRPHRDRRNPRRVSGRCRSKASLARSAPPPAPSRRLCPV